MIPDITGGWVRPKCANKRDMSIYLVYIINAEGAHRTHTHTHTHKLTAYTVAEIFFYSNVSTYND